MKIYTYLFFLAVGLFMMTAAMCNKETPKPTRPVFEADTTGTGGKDPADTTPPPPPKPTKAKLFVTVYHNLDPSTPLDGTISNQEIKVTIGMEADTNGIIREDKFPYPVKTPNKDGVVIFENLEPGTYFIYGEMTDPNGKVHDNWVQDGDFHTPRPLFVGDNEKEIYLNFKG